MKLYYFYVLLPLILLFANISFISVNEKFMHNEFQKYNVFSEFENADEIMHEIVVYYYGGEELNVPEFNSREINHMKDVKKLFRGTIFLLYLSMILYFFMFFIYIKDKPNEIKQKISKLLIKSSYYSFLFFIGFIIMISVMFRPLFILFHLVFFSSGTWTFDPKTEIIVRLFPEGIFFDIILYTAIYIVVELIVIFLMGYLLKKIKFRKWKSHRQ